MRDEDTLSLEVQVADAVEPLYTDRALAYRALGNLVHNAVKFTEKGMIQVEAEPADPGVRIAVRDTGVGIDPDVRDRIFEPFKQESEGRARTHEGTGLGLALTKRMVDLLGGTVEVESVKGEGSTFLLELPPVVPSEKTVVEAETA
jgi:signal transduction histidine kinase